MSSGLSVFLAYKMKTKLKQAAQKLKQNYFTTRIRLQFILLSGSKLNPFKYDMLFYLIKYYYFHNAALITSTTFCTTMPMFRSPILR